MVGYTGPVRATPRQVANVAPPCQLRRVDDLVTGVALAAGVDVAADGSSAL